MLRASGQVIGSFRQCNVLVNCISFEAWGRNVIDPLTETGSPVHTSTPVQPSSVLALLLVIAAASADDTSLGTTDVVFSPRLITPSQTKPRSGMLAGSPTLPVKARTYLHLVGRLRRLAFCPHLFEYSRIKMKMESSRSGSKIGIESRWDVGSDLHAWLRWKEVARNRVARRGTVAMVVDGVWLPKLSVDLQRQRIRQVPAPQFTRICYQ